MTTRVLLLFAALGLAGCADAPTSINSLAPASVKTVRTDRTSGDILVGLTDNNELVTFDSRKSNKTIEVVQISGLQGGEQVVGIDYRPSDAGTNGTDDIGKLYGVTTASRLYVINPATGAATNPVTLSVSLQGTSFGVGFNPVADRLRIHSNTGQNLRINVETGLTAVDTPLAYIAGDVNFGQDPDITATAYTNSDNNSLTGTVLYAIDAARDVLVSFGPAVGATPGPNTGKLVTEGPLGVDADFMSGFDINNAGIAYAVLNTSASGKSVLYTIDLETGAATKLGMLAQTKGTLLSVAIRP